jgi:hypothetical protein
LFTFYSSLYRALLGLRISLNYLLLDLDLFLFDLDLDFCTLRFFLLLSSELLVVLLLRLELSLFFFGATDSFCVLVPNVPGCGSVLLRAPLIRSRKSPEPVPAILTKVKDIIRYVVIIIIKAIYYHLPLFQIFRPSF